MVELIGNALILLGTIFLAIASLGLWRMKDLYLKMHAATKAGTLGCGFVLLGVGVHLHNIHTMTEVVLLILFLMITNPISAHLLGRLGAMQKNNS